MTSAAAFVGTLRRVAREPLKAAADRGANCFFNHDFPSSVLLQFRSGAPPPLVFWSSLHAGLRIKRLAAHEMKPRAPELEHLVLGDYCHACGRDAAAQYVSRASSRSSRRARSHTFRRRVVFLIITSCGAVAMPVPPAGQACSARKIGGVIPASLGAERALLVSPELTRREKNLTTQPSVTAEVAKRLARSSADVANQFASAMFLNTCVTTGVGVDVRPAFWDAFESAAPQLFHVASAARDYSYANLDLTGVRPPPRLHGIAGEHLSGRPPPRVMLYGRRRPARPRTSILSLRIAAAARVASRSHCVS